MKNTKNHTLFNLESWIKYGNILNLEVEDQNESFSF